MPPTVDEISRIDKYQLTFHNAPPPAAAAAATIGTKM